MLSFKNKIIEAHYEKHFSTANIGTTLAYSVLSQGLVGSVFVYKNLYLIVVLGSLEKNYGETDKVNTILPHL